MSRSLLATGQEYDSGTRARRHREPCGRCSTPTEVSLLACVMWIATRVGRAWPAIADLRWPTVVVAVAASAVAVVSGVRGRMWVVLMIACAGLSGGAAAWRSVAAPAPGTCGGVAFLRSDPEVRGHATTAILEIDGRRWRAIAHGRHAGRLSRFSAGEVVDVDARCAAGVGRFAEIDKVRHVVGVASVTGIGESATAGSRVALASNRVRRALADGASALDRESGALFLGLVIGDDRSQSPETVAAFRAAGLSHLTAVSGQNIAYLLALAAPLLALLARWWRLTVVVVLVAWFVVLTRAEPSVVRAAAMAVVSAAVAAGPGPSHRFANGRTVLAIAVLVVLTADPMLAWSVGFALSAAATAGLAWLSTPLQSVFGGGRWARVVVPALAAQIATAPVSLLVFGSVPVVGLLANPLAVPVAGVVMTVGIPLALLASFVDPAAPAVAAVLSPLVGWVATVARWSCELGPRGLANALSWVLVATVVTVRSVRWRATVGAAHAD